MTDWQEADDQVERLSRAAPMPVGRDARKKAASKTTWRDRVKSKRIGRELHSFKKRRNKKVR